MYRRRDATASRRRAVPRVRFLVRFRVDGSQRRRSQKTPSLSCRLGSELPSLHDLLDILSAGRVPLWEFRALSTCSLASTSDAHCSTLQISVARTCVCISKRAYIYIYIHAVFHFYPYYFVMTASPRPIDEVGLFVIGRSSFLQLLVFDVRYYDAIRE